MRRRSLLGAIAAAVPAAMTVGCDESDRRPPARRLTIATAAPGEVYDVVGSALAEAARVRWRIEVDVLRTTGSVDNVNAVADRRADLAFTTLDVADAAREGNAPFANAVALAAVASLYDDYLHVVVRADDTRIRRVADLEAVRVSTGPVGSAADVVARRVLSAVGLGDLTYRVTHHLTTADAARALENGAVDAYFFTGGLPDRLVSDLAGRVPIRLLPVMEEVTALRQRFGDYFVTRSIPAGTYGNVADVTTLGIRTVIVVRSDLPLTVAYGLTQLLFAAQPDLERAHDEALRLNPRSAVATFPVPLHPGSASYYRDVKPLA
jgi:uncharacterized protein